MANQLGQLRQLGVWLRQATMCPTCGKSTMVAVASHRGHGTGRHSESYYSATSYETVSTSTHCTCPGGPCDQQARLTSVPADSPTPFAASESEMTTASG
jgi:hypothetical protein